MRELINLPSTLRFASGSLSYHPPVSAFLPQTSPIVASDAEPTAWMLVLHGIYGSGANWRTFARKLVADRRDWGVQLVDLRMHGDSQDAPPPHTLDAAATDIAALVANLAQRGMRVRAVSGHSFGGKVALRYRGMAGESLVQTWMLDASPSVRPDAWTDPSNTVVGVLELLESLPTTFDSRDDFVDAVTARGQARPLAQWLAMNLEPEANRYRVRLDLEAIRALLASYYEQDLWELVDGDYDGELHVVAAGKSSALSNDDRDHLRAASVARAQVHIHELPDAGHWLHIDSLPALLALFSSNLPHLRD